MRIWDQPLDRGSSWGLCWCMVSHSNAPSCHSAAGIAPEGSQPTQLLHAAREAPHVDLLVGILLVEILVRLLNCL